ncbi:hypothetical protein Saro_0820 [Novosphingobium aromaticivorans DSM 12444]|uniref:Uncharacterized protein n=1 Tax=Novosphingobium aromaticivorans (strain ATCC 700278 / DSM 12444 / CCUG 56034 / CIP 105152 / NBRC 16084 / F199) TaxID=279238 RepID=Q2GA58_NOVAD|nr:hypothetical protein [Novosphingobium aromaticivorans]ABD25265.1 hypothetical protein Saro_0820 [Novosphingobium aromaticivorans DSM 12444]SCX88349.1 hypothetical protein SAMN05660666_00149 [Novosphingobium aromaticivorans]
MVATNRARDQQPQELSGVVVGWKHRTFSENIHLTVQSTTKGKPTPEAVDTHHLLMTRNQAFLLANYLLQLTGQEDSMPRRRSFLSRFFT